MSLKIDINRSGVAHHITDGPFTFPYAIDAHEAARVHPLEWKLTAWTDAEADAAFAARDKADMPEPIPPAPLSAAEQEAQDEYNKVVAEAAARLQAVRDRERLERPQVEQDEAAIASPPPVRRPVREKPETPAQRRKRLLAEA